MLNLVYSLIQENTESVKSIFKVESKTSKENENYFMLFPLNQDGKTQELLMNNKLYVPIEYHITIYEITHLKEQNAAFHITIEFKNNEESYKIITREYFDEFGKPIHATYKVGDVFLNNIQGYDNVLNFSKDKIIKFYNIVQSFYNEKRTNYLMEYKKILDDLENKSHCLENTSTSINAIKKYKIYENALKEATTYIESQSLFFKETASTLDILKGLLKNITVVNEERIQEKINLSISKEKITPSIDLNYQQSSTKKISKIDKDEVAIREIDNNLKKIALLDKYTQIISEYELQKSKLRLLKKDNDILITLARIRDIETIASSIIATFIIKKDNCDMNERDFSQLLNLNQTPQGMICLAVKNNNVTALKLILKKFPLTNLNIKTTPIGEKVDYYLLELSYNKKYYELFKLLLESGAVPDFKIEDPTKYQETLLQRTCQDNRTKEMKDLLEVKANPYYKSLKGYHPLGSLLCNYHKNKEARPAIKAQIRLFLQFFSNKNDYTVINYRESFTFDQSSALAKTCIWDLPKLAELLLEHHANPNILCSNLSSPLDRCIEHDNMSFFQMVLTKSLYKIEEGLYSAYAFAIKNNKSEFISVISNYIKNNNLKIDNNQLIYYRETQQYKTVEKEKRNYLNNLSEGVALALNRNTTEIGRKVLNNFFVTQKKTCDDENNTIKRNGMFK